MGISDDIQPIKKSAAKPKLAQKPAEMDEIKIKYSRESDKSEESSANHQRSQMEDDFFADHKTKQEIFVTKEDFEEPQTEKPKEKYNVDDYHQPKKHGNPMTKWVVLLILILIALLVWQNWSKIEKFVGFGDESESNTETLPNYTSTTEGTDYTATPETTPETATPAATTIPTIDKSKVTIQILNGNGIAGSANKVKADLVAAGFTIDSVKNALKFSYPSSIIYYKTEKSPEADLVKTSLPSLKTELINDDSIVGNYDIVIVVGKT